MEPQKFTQKRIAIVLVAVLVGLSGITIWRNHKQNQDTDNKDVTAKVEQPKDHTEIKKEPEVKPETETETKTKPEAEPETETKKAPTSEYSYTAKLGDSFIGLSRQALTSYSKQTNTTLNSAQLLQAENTLATKAGFPLLDVGQTVAFTPAELKDAVALATTTQVPTQDTKADTKQENQKSATAEAYSATAKAGQSYTIIARQAVTNYLEKNTGTTLTPAQRVAAETYITKAAGEPQLEIGQNVTITKAVIDSAITQASALTPQQQARWNNWARNVTF